MATVSPWAEPGLKNQLLQIAKYDRRVWSQPAGLLP
jgi:hypothetical protein